MKRRSFIQAASLLSAPLLLNGIPVSAVSRAAFLNELIEENDRVLVLIQLLGGNDGLNTIIPLDQYDRLANVRSNIILPQSEILPLTGSDTVGFHPGMDKLRKMYDEGKMTVMHDVGYPGQNRSHFRSTDIWTTGSPADEFWRTGWLGRYFQTDNPDFPVGYPNSENPDPFALTIGSLVSETCQGNSANFSMALTDPFSISPLPAEGQDVVPNNHYGEELTFLRQAIEQTNAYGDTIVNAANLGNNLATYPDGNRLAEQMKIISLLIAGGLKTKVYVANLGGFDTHANQVVAGEPLTGNHSVLLNTISEAVSAFQEDLRQLGLDKRVITMTFSEFGRRIQSNASFGTDHGTAAPLMLFGSCLNAGILGNNPEIPEVVETQDGVPMQFDFRNVYGSILMDWFGVNEDNVKILLSEDFQHLPIIEGCELSTSSDDGPFPYTEEIEAFNYPNPFKGWTTISFKSRGERIRISVFDTLGSELQVLSDQHFPEGVHEIRFDGGDLAAGNYFFSLFSASGVKTKAMVKV